MDAAPQALAFTETAPAAFHAAPGSAPLDYSAASNRELEWGAGAELRPYYHAEGITIFHGDCREIVPQLGTFDLLLTDPPYGIKRSGQAATNCKNPKHNRKLHEDLGWDEAPPERWVIEMLRSHAHNAIIWGANYFPQCFEPRMGWLVWDKGQDFSTSDCELAFGSYDRALRRLVINRGDVHRDVSQHPTQKPEKLMRWCIQQAGDVQTVLDPYAGSGTTGRAAKDLGKRCVLIEREERFCEIAARRLSQGVLSLGGGGAEQVGDEQRGTNEGEAPNEKMSHCEPEAARGSHEKGSK